MAVPLGPASDSDREEEEGVANVERRHEGYARLSDYVPQNEAAAHVDVSIGDDGIFESPLRIEDDGSQIRGHDANGGIVVAINGMDVHVYGGASGLGIIQQEVNTRSTEEHALDSEEEEEEERRRVQAEIALQEANEADAAWRSAPLPPDRCKAITDAMKEIDIGGYRPDWADRISEEQWISRLRKALD